MRQPQPAARGSHAVHGAFPQTALLRAVNAGDSTTAVAQLVRPIDVLTFTESVASSQDHGIRYRSVEADGDRLVLWVTFSSHQDPGKGPAERPEETCTDWSLDFTMAQKNGLWLIESTQPHGGVRSVPCARPGPEGSPGD